VVVYRLNGSLNGKHDQNGLAASGQNSLFKLRRRLLHTIQNGGAFLLIGVSLAFCTLFKFSMGAVGIFSAEPKIAQARARATVTFQPLPFTIQVKASPKSHLMCHRYLLEVSYHLPYLRKVFKKAFQAPPKKFAWLRNTIF
jgi:hypothetical protein